MQDDFLGFDENPGSDDAPSTSTASGGQPPSARPVTAGPACLGPIATRMREFPPAAFDMDETYASKTTFRPPGLSGVPEYPPSTVPANFCPWQAITTREARRPRKSGFLDPWYDPATPPWPEQSVNRGGNICNGVPDRTRNDLIRQGKLRVDMVVEDMLAAAHLRPSGSTLSAWQMATRREAFAVACRNSGFADDSWIRSEPGDFERFLAEFARTFGMFLKARVTTTALK